MDILKFTVCGYFKGDPCYRLYISLAIIRAAFVQFLSTSYNILNIQFSFSFRSCKSFCIKFCTSQNSNQQRNTKEHVKFVTARTVYSQDSTASSYLPPRREVTSRTLYGF